MTRPSLSKLEIVVSLVVAESTSDVIISSGIFLDLTFDTNQIKEQFYFTSSGFLSYLQIRKGAETLSCFVL